MAKAKSGGGITMNKNVSPAAVKGSATRSANPEAVSRMGAKVGNHAMEKGTIPVKSAALFGAPQPSVKLGNEMTKIKPTVHGSGSQGRH